MVVDQEGMRGRRYVEQLHLEAMIRRGGRYKKGLNRGMRFIRHSVILRKIHMVAERLGIRVVGCKSKTHQLGMQCMRPHIQREPKWAGCSSVRYSGHTANADGNAAINIIQRGTYTKVPAGKGMALVQA